MTTIDMSSVLKTQNALSSHEKSLAETMKSIELSSGIAELATGLNRSLPHLDLERLGTTMKSLEMSSAAADLIAKLNRNQEAIRVALGPFEELRRNNLVGIEFKRIQDSLAATESKLRFPEIAGIAKQLQGLDTIRISDTLARYQTQASEFQSAIQAMRAPWLDIQNKLNSLGGFAALQGIGHALRTMPAFDTGLTKALRIDLGDWTGRFNWPQSIFSDPLARTSFYKERGFNPALTAFPARAFGQSLTIAGLKGVPPPVRDDEAALAEENGEEESAFQRNNRAHDWLQRFEYRMRKFVDAHMTLAFGANWIKHQVPGDIRMAWLEKREKAKQNGEAGRPLIAYADFTDYQRIVTRADNWEKVFRAFFVRRSSIEESFRRLYPIRICTMHARPITQDDELFLLVEVRRIMAAIRRLR
ncbi:MAG: hypothetical protein E4H01_07915 [Lysobacterales bacterium]|nr:MAG: hypothetical protein E4H01_07915 [Xanthomonadales bacterium]